MNSLFKKGSTKLLILLLLADLAFIVVHIIFELFLKSNTLFSINRDLGYAEVYQYIKEFWILVLLFVLAVKSKRLIYFSWSVLFLYLLLDDSLQLHENIGSYLANHHQLQPVFRLRAQDLGELMVFVSVGFLLFSFVGGAYFYSDDSGKEISKHLFILVISLAFFGGLVDMLHIAVSFGKPVFALIEDGGEMIIMSIIVWYVFDIRSHQLYNSDNAKIVEQNR
ncbi:MAG: hypothetical protein B6D82_12620 [gamma proteobacterium symbiont of Ctena orbiculata]|nr:MAG: hypothetical protein B6D82_12620 [gamma proteobacterium symbiont of Ctena orbiculata]